MRRLRLALWPAGLALGVAAESIGRPQLIALDAAAGFTLLALGLAVWERRPDRPVGPILTLAGVAWFVGTFGGWAVFLHRGALAHLLLSYPSGVRRSKLDRAAIIAAYVYAAAYPLARTDGAAIVFGLGLIGLSARRYVVAWGRERRGRAAALAAALAFGLVTAAAGIARLAGAGDDRYLLPAYEVVVVFLAAGLVAELLWGRWSRGTVTGLVVDLGERTSGGSLRDRLARALGDPTLVIAYSLPDGKGYFDESGRAFALPAGEAGRAVTPIDDSGRRIAVLVHDAAVLDDPELVAAVAAAARLAVSNVRLQAEIRARVADVEASRRRIVDAADAQRRRLEHELREGAERRLARVAVLLAECHSLLGDVAGSLESARRELRELARGIHPGALIEGGLASALPELAARSSVIVQLNAFDERLPASVEAAAYFVCSEALANVAKHAQASSVSIELRRNDDGVLLRIADDGIGGADALKGSGLSGLGDRVEALGGRLLVESPARGGTCLIAQLPC